MCVSKMFKRFAFQSECDVFEEKDCMKKHLWLAKLLVEIVQQKVFWKVTHAVLYSSVHESVYELRVNVLLGGR